MSTPTDSAVASAAPSSSSSAILSEINEVNHQLAQVEQKLSKVEQALEQISIGEEEKTYLRTKEESLNQQKVLLHQQKVLLLEKEARAATAVSFDDRLQSKLEEHAKKLEEVKQELSKSSRKSIALSDITSPDWKKFEDECDYQIVPQDWTNELTERLFSSSSPSPPPDPPAFKWSDQSENNPTQVDAYLQYLGRHLSHPRNVRLMQAPHNLLDSCDPRLPFDVKGTTDVIVVEQSSVSNRLVDSGLRVILELKKDLNNQVVKYRHQAILETIIAVAKSYFRPFTVLSDLNTIFHFYWTYGNQIHCLTAPSRQAGFLLLNALLAECSSDSAEISIADQFLSSLPVPIHKRQKISPPLSLDSAHSSDSKLADEDDDGYYPDDAADRGADGPGWDEEDCRMMMRRKMHRMLRNTSFLREYYRPSPLSSAGRAMFA